MTIKKPKLTIIVTAYNNGLYIRECLESIHQQTFQDFQVIVVEDNSSDNTREIVQSYIQDKEKFQLVELSSNSGSASLPRNTGLDKADTDYVMFMDGDDWYTLDACEKLINAIQTYDSDMVCGQVMRTNTYDIWFHKLLYAQTKINFNLRAMPDLLYCGLSVNKIYKRSFLNQHHLRFLNGHLYEDILFISQAYLLAEKITILDELVYYWRVVENTGQKSVTNQRDNLTNFLHRIKIHDLLDDFMMANKDHIYLQRKNQRFLKHDFVLYLNDYHTFDQTYKETFQQTMHAYLNKRLNRQEYLTIPERNRVAAYLLHVGDFKGFEAYAHIMNNEPVQEEWVKRKDQFLYLHSDKTVGAEHYYLNIKKPSFHLSLDQLTLDSKSLSFTANWDVGGVNHENSSVVFYLEEVVSKKRTELVQANGRFSTQVTLPVGQYVLKFDLVVHGIPFTYACSTTFLSKRTNLQVVTHDHLIQTYTTRKNNFGIRVLYPSDRKMVTRKLRQMVTRQTNRWIRGMQKNVHKVAKKVFEKAPLDEQMVLFESHMGKQYSDSPKYIYEALKQQNKRMKFVWAFEDPTNKTILAGDKKVKKGSLAYLYYLSKSKYWVDNQGISHWVKKKKKQIYIQTWHGTPLKRMGHDQKAVKSAKEMKKLTAAVNSWDYFISPNAYATDIFKRAFQVNSGILEYGYPRNDYLVTHNEEQEIRNLKQALHIDQTKQVILFAPTFRDWDKNANKVIDDVLFLAQNVPTNYLILLRSHYLVTEQLKHVDMPPNVVDLSTYDDINHVYLVSDLLITDYSSVMFDYALLNRPIITYCYDYDLYTEKRGLYFDLKEQGPGAFAENMEEVCAYIGDTKTLDAYAGNLKHFRETYGHLEDGGASSRVIQKLFNH